MINILFNCLVVCIYLYLIFSPMCFFYWYFKYDFKYMEEKFFKTGLIVYLGTNLFSGIVLAIGFYHLFFFIPESWGSYDEEGNLWGIRNIVACYLTVGIIGFFHYVFTQLDKYKVENRIMKRRFLIDQTKKDILGLDNDKEAQKCLIRMLKSDLNDLRHADLEAYNKDEIKCAFDELRDEGHIL
jgi:hypothetical protein